MTDTFLPPMQPSIESSRDTEVRTLETQFGDGYTQRSADGLNSILPKWNAVWKSLTPEEAQDIDYFFRSQGGYKAFIWQAPEEDYPQMYRCKKWQYTFSAGLVHGITATIERVADFLDMADIFASEKPRLGTPPEHSAIVTPNDGVDLAFVSQALVVGVPGTLKVTTNGGETTTYTENQIASVGGYLLGRFTRVWATGTTATEISSLW